MLDRGAQQVWLALVNTAHDYADSIQSSRDGSRVINVGPPRTYAVAELGGKLRGFFKTPASHDYATQVMRREIGCNPAPHCPVATNDEDVLLCVHSLVIS
jgi:hypothetical protein